MKTIRKLSAMVTRTVAQENIFSKPKEIVTNKEISKVVDEVGGGNHNDNIEQGIPKMLKNNQRKAKAGDVWIAAKVQEGSAQEVQ